MLFNAYDIVTVCPVQPQSISIPSNTPDGAKVGYPFVLKQCVIDMNPLWFLVCTHSTAQ